MRAHSSETDPPHTKA